MNKSFLIGSLVVGLALTWLSVNSIGKISSDYENNLAFVYSVPLTKQRTLQSISEPDFSAYTNNGVATPTKTLSPVVVFPAKKSVDTKLNIAVKVVPVKKEGLEWTCSVFTTDPQLASLIKEYKDELQKNPRRPDALKSLENKIATLKDKLDAANCKVFGLEFNIKF